MSFRLVIPAGANPADVAYAHRPETWQQLADDAGCDGVEVLGSAWCIANRIGGLGIASEFVAPPEPQPPTPGLVDVLHLALVGIEAPMSAADVAAVLADAIAPLVGGI